MAVKRRATRRPKVLGTARPRAVPSAADAESDLSRNIHLSRAQEYPSDELVHEGLDDDWKPPALLDAPPPRPGMVQRWIRVEERGGVQDFKNLGRKRGEGWQPRDPRTVPGGWSSPTLNHSHLGSCIMVEGMVLMEMPERRNAQRAAYYQRQLDRQTEAIDRQLMQVQAKGHPIDRQAHTRVTVTKGRRPPVQDDEAA